MKFNVSNLPKLAISASLMVFGYAGLPCIAAAQAASARPVTPQTDMQPAISGRDVEITLYDAETIARINAKPDAAVKAEVSGQTPTLTDAVNPRPTVEVKSAAEAPALKAAMISMPQKTVSKYPRDISDQITGVVSGVPIIKSPKKCGSSELDIDVAVQDVEDSKGFIVADLHNDIEEDFLAGEKVVLRVRMPATEGETKFCIPLTQPGDYAVAIYHDKNGNEKFDKNFLGLPKEHFGMSMNPQFGRRSPTLEETIFTVPEGGKKVSINLFSTSDIMGGRKNK